MIFFKKKQEIEVGGMGCTGCEQKVEKALKEIPEVITAKADHKTGKAVITSKEGVSEEKVKAAIESVNKTYLGIKDL